MIISQEDCKFFVEPTNISKEIKEYFKSFHITILHYNDFYSNLTSLHGKIWLDPNSTNYAIFKSLNQLQCTLYLAQSPISLLKACKNTVEINGSKYVHRKDASAIVQFMYWLENNWHLGIDELKAQDILFKFRQNQSNFQGNSF